MIPAKTIISQLFLAFTALWLVGCNAPQKQDHMDSFNHTTEQFADIRILRYEIPGFENLELRQKILIYYLHEAALAGRDIYWDQNYRHNLTIRKTLEEIIKQYNGDRNHPEFQQFLTWCKRVFVANGIHHHYSMVKIIPEFSQAFFSELITNSPDGNFPEKAKEDLDFFIDTMATVLFDPEIDTKRVNLSPEADMALESANNFYSNVSQDEVLEFYSKYRDPSLARPVMYGLNSQLLKTGGEITERVWRTGEMYSRAIEQIIYWLEKAMTVAESQVQRHILRKLIEYYETGDLTIFDEYNILWVNDTSSEIDFANGFIEVYGDPFGLKGAYQSMVYITDDESDARTRTISENARWFEINMPINRIYKKTEVSGISARAVHIAAVAGDNSPTPPLGVNLPNSDWIRREHGSKSITISNISEAYHKANIESGVIDEFACSPMEAELAKKYGFLANNLHTDLHEIVGHGSGRLRPGVEDMSITLRNYASVIEETRADLAALYFIMDPKMFEWQLIPSPDAAKAQYNQYVMNGLMQQLYRVQQGSNIEQTHMRNRQIIASLAMEMGKEDQVIEKLRIDDKTCFRINDHQKLREIFGEMLHEVQRIKSEGDYDAAKELVEKYGVKADQKLLNEVHQRYKKLGIPPYTAFINPIFIPVIRNDRIVDIQLEYHDNFLDQMLYYGERYGFLPLNN